MMMRFFSFILILLLNSCHDDLESLFDAHYQEVNEYLIAGFNPNLMSEMEQMDASYYFQSDTAFENEVLISPLQPRIGSQFYGKINKGICYWVRENSAIDLNWEIVVGVNSPRVNLEKVGMCTFGDPKTRETLLVDGDRFLPSDLAMTETENVGLYFCSQPQESDFNECDSEVPLLETQCEKVKSPCLSQKQTYYDPYCKLGCQQRVNEDGYFKLSIDRLDNDANLLSYNFEPRIKVLSQGMKLSRLLQPEFSLPQQARQKFIDAYTWVVDSQGMSWNENFSPDMTVKGVRVFQQLQNGNLSQKRYYRIHSVLIFNGNEQCRLNVSQDSQTDVGECAYKMTPTYFHQDPLTKIQWRVEFHRNMDENLRPIGNLPFDRNEPLYLEFEISEGYSSVRQGLRSDKSKITWRIKRNESICKKCVSFYNPASYPVYIDSIRYEGDENVIQVSSPHSKKINPHSKLDLDLFFNRQMSQKSRHTGFLNMRYGRYNEFEELRVVVDTIKKESMINIVPPVINFKENSRVEQALLIENIGDDTLYDLSLKLTGDQSDLFEIRGNLPRTLSPGDSRILTVIYKGCHFTENSVLEIQSRHEMNAISLRTNHNNSLFSKKNKPCLTKSKEDPTEFMAPFKLF